MQLPDACACYTTVDSRATRDKELSEHPEYANEIDHCAQSAGLHDDGCYTLIMCSKCVTAERIPGQRWRRNCLTAYQRQRRQHARLSRSTVSARNAGVIHRGAAGVRD